MQDCKRKLTEVVAIYELEPTLRDIYVEGVYDKKIYGRIYSKYISDDISFYTANDLDFSDFYEEHDYIKRSSKKKLCFLSQYLSSKLPEGKALVSVVVDRDFDSFLDNEVENDYLLYTDYSCLESYFFNGNVLDIFYGNSVGDFPVSGETTIKNIKEVLVNRYLIRSYLSENNIGMDNLVGMKKCVGVNKSSNDVSFDVLSHAGKILGKAGEFSKINDIDQYIKSHKVSALDCVKSHIHGHDFTDLLFHYMGKVKSSLSIDNDAFYRILLLSIDYSELSNYGLFKKFMDKYAT